MDDPGVTNDQQAKAEPLAGAGPVVEQTVRGVLEQHVASLARKALDRHTAGRLDPGRIEQLAVQAAERQLAELSDPPGLYFLTVEEWVGEWLFPVYRRSVLGHDRVWCPEWWRHAEAVARLESLWRAWEHLRQDAATGLSVWFRDHADHHMTILLDSDGPFKGCDGHHSDHPLSELPHDPPPRGHVRARRVFTGAPAARTSGRAGSSSQRWAAAGAHHPPRAMTGQLRTVSALGAAIAAALVLGVPLSILLLLDPASSAACGASSSGPGPTSVSGIPPGLLPVFEGASQQLQLGSDGWAYLAALNYAESAFGADNGPGTGVLSGSNSAGAAGPMQIGIGGAATDNWDTIVAEIPAGLSGGAQPPSVYDETDAVYGAAILLHRWGAPGDWPAALVAWNDYPPEIAQVNQLVAQYTQAASGPTAAPPATPSPPPAGGAACSPPAGPTTPGAVAEIQPEGTAAIPAGAPPAVQQAIAAGNRIIDTAYSTERNPRMLSTVQSAYDCSGATDFVLYNSSLSSPQVDVGNAIAGDSTLLEGYGQSGAGQWITVYASAGHAFIRIAGIVLDTAHYAPTSPSGSGPRWQPASILAAQLADGNQWTQRHPEGL